MTVNSPTCASEYYASRGLFVLSDVNAEFLRKHNIKMSVSQFKTLVRFSEPLKFVITGAYGYENKTPVYSINSFSNLMEVHIDKT